LVFTAKWYHPCKGIDPLFYKAASNDKFKELAFYMVEIDTAIGVARQAGVTTIMSYKEKVKVEYGGNPSTL